MVWGWALVLSSATTAQARRLLDEPQLGALEDAGLAAGAGPFLLGFAEDGRPWRGRSAAQVSIPARDAGVLWGLSVERDFALGLLADNQGDRHGFWLLRLDDPDQAEPEILHHWVHGTVDPGLDPERLWAVTRSNDRITHYATVRADGALCYGAHSRVACFHGDGRVEDALAAAELPARLPDAASRFDTVEIYGAVGRARGGIFDGGLTATPDGSLYALVGADVEWTQTAPDLPAEAFDFIREVRWVLALRPNGAVQPISRPVVLRWAFVPGVRDPTIFMPSLLENAVSLSYSPRLDAVMAWPVEHLDYGWVDFSDRLTAGYVGPGRRPVGWSGGTGAAFFPLDGSGDGYQSWREALITRQRDGTCIPDTVVNSSLAACLDLPFTPVPGPDGRLGGAVFDDGGPRYYPLALNGEQDLDGDGLDATAEAALGTSDWRYDSDGGGVSDLREARLLDADPTDPTDEPGAEARAVGLRFLVSSPLVQMRLPEAIANPRVDPDRVRTLSARGPLCARGTCYGADGAPLVDYGGALASLYDPATGEGGGQSGQGETIIDVPPVLSSDGRFLLIQTSEGLRRFWLGDGTVEPAVDYATLARAFGLRPQVSADGARLLTFPVDRDRLFVMLLDRSDVAPRVALVDGDGALQVLLDLDALCADEGLPCQLDHHDNVLRQDLWRDLMEPLGWSEGMNRLLIRLWTRWDAPVIGVGADGTVERVEGLAENVATVTANEPWQVLPPAPVFDRFQASTGHGEWYTGRDLVDESGTPLPAIIGARVAHGDPFSAWGDALLFDYFESAEQGLHELVRYEDEVRAGDVLVLAYLRGTVGAAGRELPMLFRSGPRGGLMPVWDTYVEGMQQPTGMDANERFEVCVADGTQVLVFEPTALSRGRATAERGRWPLPGAADCQLHADGLRALVGADVYRLRGDVFEATGETAQAFYRDQAGAPHQLAPGGSRLDALVPEGYAAPAGLVAGPMVRRADGLVVFLAPSEDFLTDTMVRVLDPVDGRLHRLDWHQLSGRAALAIVPGGEGQDPWARADNTRLPDGRGGPGPSPSGDAGTEDGGHGGGGGCAFTAAPAPTGVTWLAGLGGLLLRRRRRRGRRG